MMLRILSYGLIFSLWGSSVAAQTATGLHCGTNDVLAKVFAEHPEIKAEYDARERVAEQQDRIDFQHHYYRTENSTQTSAPDYIIPVVFHIIHEFGSENISDAQVLDEMNILNRDYRLLNADTSTIVDGFDSIMADTKIEFRLANVDPNGNCTNGIEHIYSPLTNIADDASKLNPWPRSKYLNVWVVKSLANSSASAYAYLPGTAPSAGTDGIIIIHNYLGSIGTGSVGLSRTLTHEVGHFLNLQHVWGNNNNAGVTCGNDGVSDTPITKGFTFCPLTNNMICTANVHENLQNYMDYSWCTVMFTQGQKVRMTNALNSGVGQRSSLWTASNLAATGALNSPANPCAPLPDFSPAAQIMVCQGGTVTFTDRSYNGQPTSWNWTFPGGTPSTSTDSIPVIVYNTPGVYDVTLTVTNANGSNTITRTNKVMVSSNTATHSIWAYTQGFEDTAVFNGDYTVVNQLGNGWTINNSSSYTGFNSIRIVNVFGSDGEMDELISPSIDFSAISGGPTFTFKVAFARHATTNMDKLRLLVSTDCGQTWTQRWIKTGAALSTITGVQSSSFVPTFTQWRTETVNMSTYATSSNVRFKFEFTSDGGNNIYIDDINIQGTNGIGETDPGVFGLSCEPNPASSDLMIVFGSKAIDGVSIDMVDMTGRVVKDIYYGNIAEGEHRVPVRVADLTSGMYFVRVTSKEGRGATQKLIVE